MFPGWVPSVNWAEVALIAFLATTMIAWIIQWSRVVGWSVAVVAILVSVISAVVFL